jgi:membrane protein YqaA with SNARE-associated domain
MQISSVKSPSYLKQLYDWCIKSAETKRAKYYLYAIAFAESSFFPLPPDLLFIPMMLAKPKNAFNMAFWLTITSVVGGILGYAIGYYLYNSLGAWIIDTYHMHAAFEKFQTDFTKYGFWIIALKGLTPIPYKIVTIASGLARFDFVTFITASIIARGFRFYLLAALLYFFGQKARHYIEKYLTLALIITLGIILIGFVIVKLVA